MHVISIFCQKIEPQPFNFDGSCAFSLSKSVVQAHHGRFVFLFAFSLICSRRPSSLRCLLSENDPPSIYFATREGVKRYSLGTDVVETVADSSEGIDGVAFDWVRNKIYWSSGHKVFRADKNGTEVETVLGTRKCKSSPSCLLC